MTLPVLFMLPIGSDHHRTAAILRVVSTLSSFPDSPVCVPGVLLDPILDFFSFASIIPISAATYLHLRYARSKHYDTIRGLVAAAAIFVALETPLSRAGGHAGHVLLAFAEITFVTLVLSGFALWLDVSTASTFAAVRMLERPRWLQKVARASSALVVFLVLVAMVITASAFEPCGRWARLVLISYYVIVTVLFGPVIVTYVILAKAVRSHLANMAQSNMSLHRPANVDDSDAPDAFQELRDSTRRMRWIALVIGVIVVLVFVELGRLLSDAKRRDGCSPTEIVAKCLSNVLPMTALLWHTKVRAASSRTSSKSRSKNTTTASSSRKSPPTSAPNSAVSSSPGQNTEKPFVQNKTESEETALEASSV